MCKSQEKEYVEIDCSGLSTAPNFHVLTDTTTTICWGEVNPAYVCKFRKLFQGPEKAVNLGDTQSARYAYTVDLWGIRMICCSNNWLEKVALLIPKDQEYIQKNTIYHLCDKPFFVDPSVEPPAEMEKRPDTNVSEDISPFLCA